MEKLELKHVVGYLPYGLKCLNQHLPDIELIIEELLGISNHITWCGMFNAKHGSNHIPVCGMKPILRPLTDLTKEIKVNGKSFVPAEYFWSVDYHEQQLFELYGTLPFYWKACLEVDIRDWEWGVVEKLYEWHFDIHGLIEKGLAIDINTLDNGIQ